MYIESRPRRPSYQPPDPLGSVIKFTALLILLIVVASLLLR